VAGWPEDLINVPSRLINEAHGHFAPRFSLHLKTQPADHIARIRKNKSKIKFTPTPPYRLLLKREFFFLLEFAVYLQPVTDFY
jgi:hypothetical protein